MESAENGGMHEAEHPLTRGLDILLVDDDNICLFIHRRVLELSGLCRSAQSATNGQRAVEILNDTAKGTAPLPDIIFLDLQMPIMDGIAFLEAFQGLELDHKERIAIVLLTSSVCEKDQAYTASLGVSHHLAKPLTAEALNEVVNAIYKCRPSLQV